MLIDAHAHLDLYSEESLERALQEISHIPVFTISNSVDLPSYQRNLEIAERCAWVLPTFGCILGKPSSTLIAWTT